MNACKSEVETTEVLRWNCASSLVFQIVEVSKRKNVIWLVGKFFLLGVRYFFFPILH